MLNANPLNHEKNPAQKPFSEYDYKHKELDSCITARFAANRSDDMPMSAATSFK